MDTKETPPKYDGKYPRSFILKTVDWLCESHWSRQDVIRAMVDLEEAAYQRGFQAGQREGAS